ncbi:MAG: HIT domain-containing protein [bacterium]
MVKKVVNPEFAKSKNYKEVLDAIEKTGKCPFCRENFKYHKKIILKKEKGWFVTKNSWPYKNTEHHFIIISEKHKEEFDELDSYDFEAVLKLVNWTIKKYKIKGGGLTLRFGDFTYTGATVCHLHFHLIVPKINKKNNKVGQVYFPIG